MWFEEFEAGQEFNTLERTVTEMDDILFASITMNSARSTSTPSTCRPSPTAQRLMNSLDTPA